MSEEQKEITELTPLTGEIKRRDFLVFDIESKADDTQQAGFTRPFMVSVYDGTVMKTFRNKNQKDGHHWTEEYYKKNGCVDQAMRYICQKKYKKHHIYSHNGGRFDMLFLCPWLMDEGNARDFKFDIVPVASSIQMLDVWRGERGKFQNWRFLDSFKLIPTGLDKAAKSFGLEGKLKHDLHMNEFDPRWRTYCEQDCKQLYDVITRFHHYIETILGGEVGITAPSTSIKLFRRKYLKNAIPRSKDTHDFVRASYVGGRVEVFKSQGEGLSYFDINSSYPSCMLEPMPGGKATLWDGTPPKRFTENQIGFVECEIYVPQDIAIPPLPLRGSKTNGLPDGKLVFPVGTLRGIWEYSELQLAMEVGCTVIVYHQSVWYEPIPMFEGFVRDLYRYRNKSDPMYDAGLDAVVKIMLNSCYGKFGQKPLRKKMYRWDDPELPADATPATGAPDSPIWYAEEETDAAYIMPQISARVTALGRVKLYRYFMQIQSVGGEIIYCDTDSIVTDVKDGVEVTTELGGLKDEYPEQSGRLSGKFMGPKLYLLTDDSTAFERVAAKGLQNRTRTEFEKFSSGETIVMNRLEKVGTLAQEGFSRGPRLREVTRTNLSIQGNRGADAKLTPGKRIMHDDGTTMPFCIDMSTGGPHDPCEETRQKY